MMINDDYLKFEKGYNPDVDYSVRLLQVMSSTSIRNLVVDYHYTYLAMKQRIAELEGKIYELEETLDGRNPLTTETLRSLIDDHK